MIKQPVSWQLKDLMVPSLWTKKKLDIWPGFMCISVDIYFFKIFTLRVVFLSTYSMLGSVLRLS